MGVAHPPTKRVELSTGKTLTLRPWTMAQRAELRPRIAVLLEELAKLEGGDQPLAAGGAIGQRLASLFMVLEEEVCEIVRESIPLEGGDGLSAEEWDAISWGDDIPALAMAIWDLNLARSGGVMGKLTAGLGGLVDQAAVRRAAATVGGGNGSQSPTATSRTNSKPGASASSPDGGEPIRSA
jgi:hypothetical protein